MRYSPFSPPARANPQNEGRNHGRTSSANRCRGIFLKPAIAELLRTIPETWAEFDLDRLTVIQDNALFLLTAAGMVERRGWLRSTIVNHPTAFEVRFKATGEGGFAKAIEQAAATEYETWKEAWRTWKTGETKDVSPFRIEAMKPQEWRLTDQGILARGELDGTKHVMGSDATFDFIFKRGFFGPGYWSRLAASNPKGLTGRLSRSNLGILVKIGPIFRAPRCPAPVFWLRFGKAKSRPPRKPSN